jgi:16S rRNA (adenine1518-N6/adenine1519-N6)-dimethyltransferase
MALHEIEIAGTVEKDQHFLINNQTIKKMILALELEKDDRVIEIGAGSGNITQTLMKVENKILAFEIDPKFKPFLDEIAEKNKNITIKIGNALDSSWKSYNKVLGNIPFSVAEAIIQKSIEERTELISLLISDGLKKTLESQSKLGLISNLFYTINAYSEVDPQSLSPIPDIKCWLVQLRRKEPSNKTESILRDILTKNGKTKNSIIFSLAKSGMTKNQARDTIEKMNLSDDVLNKPIKRSSAQFILRLKSELDKL